MCQFQHNILLEYKKMSKFNFHFLLYLLHIMPCHVMGKGYKGPYPHFDIYGYHFLGVNTSVSPTISSNQLNSSGSNSSLLTSFKKAFRGRTQSVEASSPLHRANGNIPYADEIPEEGEEMSPAVS